MTNHAFSTPNRAHRSNQGHRWHHIANHVASLGVAAGWTRHAKKLFDNHAKKHKHDHIAPKIESKVFFKTHQPAGPHGDLSQQSITIHIGSGKSPKGSKFEYLHSGCSVSTIPEGTQSCMNVPFAGTVQQFIRSQPNGPVYTNVPDLWATNPFDLNPQEYPSGGWVTGPNVGIVNAGVPATIATGATVAIGQPLQDRIFLNHADLMYMISNSGTVPVFVDCMWFLAKKDLVATGITYGQFSTSASLPSAFNANSYDPWRVWRNALAIRAMGQGAVIQPTIADINNAPIAGAIDPTAYGMSPLSERGFRNMYKLIKRTTLTLQAGECHKLLAKVHFNKVIDKETYNILSQNGTNIKSGVTLCPLFIVRPGAVSLSSATSGNPTANTAFFATTGTGKVSLVHTGYYSFTSMEGKRFDISRNQGGLIAGNYGYGTSGSLKETLINAVDAMVGTSDE